MAAESGCKTCRVAKTPLYRLDLVALDQLLLDVAHRHNTSIPTVEEAGQRLPAFTVADLASVSYAPEPAEYGPITSRLWTLTYVLFVARGIAVTPPPFSAKSVLLARPKLSDDPQRNFLTVGGIDGAPVLVPYPPISSILIEEPADASFADAADALRDAAHVLTERVNLAVPLARLLLEELD